MRKTFGLAAFGAIIAAIASGCGSPHAVEVTLSNASFSTTGGNLFNCSSPAQAATSRAVNLGPIACEPNRAADGSFTTTPVTVLQSMGCGDGHGAIVQVTCAGTGAGNDVAVTVSLSIGASCGTKDGEGADPQTFVFQDVAPEDTQTSTLGSCAAFEDFCTASNACAFNQFSADISVSNSFR